MDIALINIQHCFDKNRNNLKTLYRSAELSKDLINSHSGFLSGDAALWSSGSGFKFFMGSGTKLIVQSKENIEPSYYKLSNDSCLATDYTDHKALDRQPAFSGQNISVRYDGEKTYSAFAWEAGDLCKETDRCKGGSSDQIDEVESDEKMNFLSLGIFWLRILFLKTVVFNVLMTVKAWMS
ncbi:M1-specific T cell receptor alpha chain-like [Triplophysa dalaica]|uniref:M1-specific T cell receptor alpha chain-like n=1 Tax=Triplophysa dalaica TaxID=1582913 RepID=UPI0024DFB8B8|nr:M1-specific T cell receptor alpha chain-like [Triplophysa dalaica]